MKRKERQVRRSQTVVPFGVGAVYDLGDESLVACDISTWRYEGRRIYLPRLQDQLKVAYFQEAPAPKSKFEKHPRRVPYFRFPRWLFCPRCRKLYYWNEQMERLGEAPCCQCRPGHTTTLVPMRFVAVCANGHMTDVPWSFWAHFGAEDEEQRNCREQRNLRFVTMGERGSGLGALFVECVECGAKRSLSGITAKDSLHNMGIACPGSQPWQRTSSYNCSLALQVLQRGATNIYYPKVVSALSIPELCDPYLDPKPSNLIMEHALFETLVESATSHEGGFHDRATTFLAEQIAKKIGCAIDEVLLVLKRHIEGPSQSGSRERQDLFSEEWQVFTDNKIENMSSSEFSAIQTNLEVTKSHFREKGLSQQGDLADAFERIVLVNRLREVRALTGFERYVPGTAVRADLGKNGNWLPAYEVFGEGIFIELREQRLQTWLSESHALIAKRLDGIQDALDNLNFAYLPKATPRFILLHTLSHLIIRQLAFESGYDSASLRERIYSFDGDGNSTPMAGILIYTADSDSEGSLGGLVRQGKPERFFPMLLSAIESATWCSADPVCRELPRQGLMGLNRAACHACCLVPEPCCPYLNVLLDRVTLAGSMENEPGFFKTMFQ